MSSLSSLQNQLDARVRAVQIAGKDPVEFLASVYGDPAHDMKLRVAAASAAAPYTNPRLKQVDINLNVDDRRPEEVDRDIQSVLEEFERRGTAPGVGRVIEGALDSDESKSHRRLLSRDGAAAS